MTITRGIDGELNGEKRTGDFTEHYANSIGLQRPSARVVFYCLPEKEA